MDVVRGGQEGADRLDRVVRDAGLAGDDLTHLHLQLEVFESEELHHEQRRLERLHLPVHIQVFQELFVPLDFFASQFVPLTALVLYYRL